ncbi:outer membrane immunogenic protein [Sphingomonas kyeonggiensis]|uniref:Outer membrane immunogenic protein n=1 Tax=Sphingomonas kyeonggiensis TaxID=1268553 RepID=A0A7W7K0X2_9SPHN|nr:porin family protein [Sphingomonas kyeonggiensis]MBB4838641.1 outer membrane immunogenic protein [Sphingomonas kyeonggiensis]
MRKSLLLTALALTAFGASAAAAQDSAEPRDTGRNPFTGPRIEATIGYDQTNEEDLGMDSRGARVGGAIGYDFAIGKTLTLGVEAGIGWGVAAGKERMGYSFPNGHIYEFQLSAGRDIDASVRLGARIGKGTLVYGKAGWADAVYRYIVYSPIPATGHGSTDNGFRLGAGVEQMLGKHIYAKAEYRYSRYDPLGDASGTSRHQLLTGLGVRF